MSVGAETPDFLASLRSRASSRLRTIAFPEGNEPRVAEAVAQCVEESLIQAVLIGDPDEVRDGVASAGGAVDRVLCADPTDSGRVSRTLARLRLLRQGRGDSEIELQSMARDPLAQGGVMLRDGEVEGAVAGAVRTTADVVRAALTCIGLAPGIATLSSAFYMVLGDDHPVGPSVLTFTDAGVVPAPTSEQLADIAVSASALRPRIVGDEPRVAFLSYSTKGSAEGASVSRVREALTAFRSRLPEALADGELQGDAALSPDVAQRKAPGSPVAGDANVLVFPDLDSANIAYKLVQRLGGAVALGPILQGLTKPYNDLSRGAVASDIVSVSCITSLMSE